MAATAKRTSPPDADRNRRQYAMTLSPGQSWRSIAGQFDAWTRSRSGPSGSVSWTRRTSSSKMG